MSSHTFAARYRRIWRWHFYAGIFCLPFILWLAITGSVYLFKPQIESFLDRPYSHLQIGTAAPLERQIAAATASVPGSHLRAYQLPADAHGAAQILLDDRGVVRRSYVDPYTLRILKTEAEESRPMRVLFHLHGELLLGDRGSMCVELAASWGIVLVLTGLYLFWPRNSRGVAGIFYPRLGAGRTTLRDMHAVTGMYVSVFALFFFVSGLPWAASWGGMLKEIRHLAAPIAATPDWPTGGEHAMHAMTGMANIPNAPVALDRIVAQSGTLGLASPILLVPPADPHGMWMLRSDTQNRPLRARVRFHQDGSIADRTGFSALPRIDRIVGIGVAAHEGQLFGLANQLLGLLSAVLLGVTALAAIALWLERKAAHHPVAPVAACANLPLVVLIAIAVLGIVLPLFGASLLVVLLLERSVFRRVPRLAKLLDLGSS